MSPRRECRQPCCIAPRPVVQGTTFWSQNSDAKNYLYESCSTCDSFIRFINTEEPGQEKQTCEDETQDDHSDRVNAPKGFAPNVKKGSVSRASNAAFDSVDGLMSSDLRTNLELSPALCSFEESSYSEEQRLMKAQRQAYSKDSAQPTFMRLSHPETTSVPFLTSSATGAGSLSLQRDYTSAQPPFTSTRNKSSLPKMGASGERTEACYEILDLPRQDSYDYGSLEVGQVFTQSKSLCACGSPVRQMEVFGGWMGNMEAWVCSQGRCGYYMISRNKQDMGSQGEDGREDMCVEEQQGALKTNEDVGDVRMA